MNKNITNSVANYYSDKVNNFGTTARGVDWNSTESQELRFVQLLKLLPEPSSLSNSFVILDYGCGFGAQYSFMEKLYKSNFKFIGYDISFDMIHQAKQLHNNKSNATWINYINQLQEEDIDYVTASGIFNVRLNFSNTEWKEYITETLNEFDKLGKKGFAFNMLTSYSDKEYMRNDLYYADPLCYFDYCKKNFSKNIALLHDYNLYEFTIIVRK